MVARPSHDDLGPDFAALLAVLPHPYLVLSPDLKAVAASDAYLSLIKSRRDAVLGRDYSDLLPGTPSAINASSVARARSSLMTTKRTGRSHQLWHQEYAVAQQAKDGVGYEKRYWNISHHPVLNRSGGVLWIVESIDDVTDAVQRSGLQDRMSSAEERLGAALEQHTVGIVYIDLDGRILAANGRFCELLNFSLDELRARTIHDLTHPDDLSASMRLAEALIDGTLPHSTIEKRYIRRDGSPLRVSTSQSLVRPANLTPPYFIIVIEDVSARKVAEAALAEREAYLRSILETVPDGMVVIDEKGTIQSFSRTAERLFGYDTENVLGRNITILMPPGDRERHDGYVQHYLDTGVPRIIGIGRVVTAYRKDGSKISVHLSVGEIAMASKRMFVGFMRDLTERQQAEARLQELQSELVHISRFTALGEMASALAHELNQPLTAATNYLKGARRLLDQGLDGRLPLLNQAIDEAAAQSLRAGQIIRRLRDFISRGESERRIEDLRKLVEEASTLALVGTAERISFDFDPAAPFVYADRIQIQQVLLNLIRNAVEAMQSSEQHQLTIATSAKPDGMVEISVTDTGVGLPPEVASHLFQPFITTKPTGMGVGLSICRTIVEAHDGQITASANPEGGTTFRVTLPAARLEETENA